MGRANKRVSETSLRVEPLRHVLGKNQLVQDRVEQAGDDLSSVNADLQQEIDQGANALIEGALNQSEAIQAEVHGAAAELLLVNRDLAAAVADRRDLEHQLSESQASEREARHDALHDEVTGLPNLALFNDRLRNALAQARRHGWRLAVMFLDLDAFKAINDTHGHDVGDLVLAKVAERLQSQVRAGDTVSRRSGDEFLVLMLESKDDDNASVFAEKLLARLAEPLELDRVTLTVRASVGIAMYPEDGKTGPALLKCADLAMYAAKRQGKGWELFSRMTGAERRPDRPSGP